jgi:hypothetical protein
MMNHLHLLTFDLETHPSLVLFGISSLVDDLVQELVGIPLPAYPHVLTLLMRRPYSERCPTFIESWTSAKYTNMAEIIVSLSYTKLLLAINSTNSELQTHNISEARRDIVKLMLQQTYDCAWFIQDYASHGFGTLS